MRDQVQPPPLMAQRIRLCLGGRAVLRSVSLTLPGPGLYALVGPNGSGKSTLLRVLAGLLRPEAGNVWVHGRALDGLPSRERARLVALVPQFLTAHADLPVEDMVALGRLRTISFRRRLSPVALSPEDRAAVEVALEATATASLRHRRFSTLSGGEGARVRLAMAVAQEASVLLLDEPMAHVDVGYSQELLHLLRRLVQEGRSVLVVLHDLTLTGLFAQRVFVLHEGQLRAEGPPEQVLCQPLLTQVFRASLSLVVHPDTGLPLVVPSLRPPLAEQAHPVP